MKTNTCKTLKSLHRQLINIYLDDPTASHPFSELLQTLAPTVRPLRGPNRAYNALNRTSTRDIVLDYLSDRCAGAYELSAPEQKQIVLITFNRGLIDSYLAVQHTPTQPLQECVQEPVQPSPSPESLFG